MVKELRVMTRSVNGSRRVLVFPSMGAAYTTILDRYVTSDDEIQLVFLGDACIYSSLGGESITWEDLLGFLA